MPNQSKHVNHTLRSQFRTTLFSVKLFGFCLHRPRNGAITIKSKKKAFPISESTDDLINISFFESELGREQSKIKVEDESGFRFYLRLFIGDWGKKEDPLIYFILECLKSQRFSNGIKSTWIVLVNQWKKGTKRLTRRTPDSMTHLVKERERWLRKLRLSTSSSLIYFTTLPMSIASMLFTMAIYSHSHFHCSIKGERRRTECYITSATSDVLRRTIGDRQVEIIIFNFHALAQSRKKTFATVMEASRNAFFFYPNENILDSCRRTLSIVFFLTRLSKDTRKTKDYHDWKGCDNFFVPFSQNLHNTKCPDSVIFLLHRTSDLINCLCICLWTRTKNRGKEKDTTRKTRNSKQKKILLENWKFLRKKEAETDGDVKKGKKGIWNRFLVLRFHTHPSWNLLFYRNFSLSRSFFSS